MYMESISLCVHMHMQSQIILFYISRDNYQTLRVIITFVYWVTPFLQDILLQLELRKLINQNKYQNSTTQ